MENAQLFIVHSDFIDLVNSVLFGFDPQRDTPQVHEALVNILEEGAPLEIALHYEAFMRCLPLQNLSAKAIGQLLPPGSLLVTRKGELSHLWKTISSLKSNSGPSLDLLSSK